MSEGYKCRIDIEKLSKSLDTLDEINSFLNTTDLQTIISDLEKSIKTINFEHGNCITNYNSELELVQDELAKIKNETSKLTDSIRKTVKNYSNVDELTNDDIDELSSLYGKSTSKKSNQSSQFRINLSEAATDINQVTNTQEVTQPITDSNFSQVTPITNEPTQIQNPTVEQTESKEINTVPIGIGIAAAGMAASAGAVVLDSLNYNNKSKDLEFEDYQSDEIVENKYEEPDANKTIEFDEVSPYHAERNREVISKFYNEDDSYDDKE